MHEIFQSMMQSLQSPARTHAMMVHLPVAGVMLGLMLVIALAITRGRSVGLRWAAFLTLLATTAGAVVAWQTGERAEGAITASLTPEAMDLLSEHYELGERAWIPIAAATALLLITLVRIVAVRMIGLGLTAIALLVALGWVSVTAHIGGKLVYVHGVGVPASENNEQPPEPTKPAKKPEHTPATSPKHPAAQAPEPATQPTAQEPAKQEEPAGESADSHAAP